MVGRVVILAVTLCCIALAAAQSPCPPEANPSPACGPVLVPYSIGVPNWYSPRGGKTVDRNNFTLGFTYVQTSSQPGGGYVPANLKVAYGRLSITCTSGIDDAAKNNQTNKLGYALARPVGPVTLSTAVEQPGLYGKAYDQAGVWFGLNEDNFAKLIVVSWPTIGYRVQILAEVGGVTVAQTVTTVTGGSLASATITLNLVVNPDASTISGSWSTDDGRSNSFPPVGVPAGLWDPSAQTGATWAYGGIYATQSRDPAPAGTVMYKFKNFYATGTAALAPPPPPPPPALNPCRPTNADAPISCGFPVIVPIPTAYDWSRNESFLVEDTNGLGTGFTHVAPGVAGDGSYKPSLLTMNRNAATLTVAATAGDAAGSNDADNMMGIGVAPFLAPLVVRAAVASFPDGPSGQAGLWVGSDQDNYVQLSVVNTATSQFLRLVVESAGSIAEGKTNNIPLPGGLVNGFNVELTLDPYLQRVSGRFWTTSPSAATSAGSLDATGATWWAGSTPGNVVTFAGIFASKGTGAALSVPFTLFSIREVCPCCVPAGAAPAAGCTVAISINSTEKVMDDGWIAHSRLQNNFQANYHNHDTHNMSDVTISNPTVNPVTIHVELAGPWDLLTPEDFTIPAGGVATVTIRYTDGVTDINCVRLTGQSNGTLSIRVNGGPYSTIVLRGLWQQTGEYCVRPQYPSRFYYSEPSSVEIAWVFGITTKFYTDDVPVGKFGTPENGHAGYFASGEEFLVEYFNSTTGSVRVKQIAAFHTCCTGNDFTRWTPAGYAPSKSPPTVVRNFPVSWFQKPDRTQSLLPYGNNVNTGALYPLDNVINPTDPFGLQTKYTVFTNATLMIQLLTNSTTGAVDWQGCTTIPYCGKFFRYFPVRDWQRQIVPQAVYAYMDYTGGNFDFNDNIYMMWGVVPNYALNSFPTPLPPH
eukprot:jgi/Chlat1/1346/Chrsp119S01758